MPYSYGPEVYQQPAATCAETQQALYKLFYIKCKPALTQQLDIAPRKQGVRLGSIIVERKDKYIVYHVQEFVDSTINVDMISVHDL